MSVKPTILALALLAAGPALAGPSQGSITPPGGFATACAGEVSGGGQYTPGLDLEGAFTFWVGRSACQSQVFSGPAGSGSAAASWSAAGVQTESAVVARMGSIGLAGHSLSAPNLQFPLAVAGGGWSESMTIDLAGHNGESAVWLFKVDVQGQLSAGSFGSANVLMNAFKNELELQDWVPGFDPGGSDGAASTDRQRVRWSVPRNETRLVDDQITFAVPVTLGQSFVWGVYGTVRVGTSVFAPSGSSTPTPADADFLHTLRYGGSAALMLDGVAVEGYTLTSASGIDWRLATPVPEPSAAVLMLAGAGLLLARRRWPT